MASTGNMTQTSRRRRIVSAAALCTLALAGCGDDDAGDDAAAATAPATAAELSTRVAASDPPATTTPPSDAPATIAPTTDTSTSPSTTVDDAAPELSDDELAAQIEAVLTDAIAPGSIRWDAPGVDVPPTAAGAAVRIPGRDDVIVAVGKNVDGSPAEADATFPVGNLAGSLVRTVAFHMVDEGVLDPTLTVDQWVPTLPSADRVTVQMVIDNETGWSDYGLIDPDPVTTDFERAWSLREVVELRATVMTALAEPGTRTDAGPNNETVLGLVVEEVGGRPLAELVRDRVSEPAGLDDTGLLDGRVTPAGYRHGVFAFNGTPTDTSGFEGVSYHTWNQATTSVVSTPTDLLDLLDVWATGELFTTDRTPAPDRYAPDPAGNPNTYVGLGVPFNGYCPCTDVDGGIEPTAIGRVPGAIGTRSAVLHYADGMSVVVNVNSNEADIADIRAVASSVHDIAAAAQ